MPFLILRCDARVARAVCEARIRELVGGYGEVARVIISERASDDEPWVAVVEMRGSAARALEGLRQAMLDGRPVRVRQARPLEVSMLMGGR